MTSQHGGHFFINGLAVPGSAKPAWLARQIHAFSLRDNVDYAFPGITIESTITALNQGV